MQAMIDSLGYTEGGTMQRGRSYFEDVIFWHKAAGHPVRKKMAPSIEEGEKLSRDLGKTLVMEEYNELIKALQDNNYPEIADGAADLIWVVCGLLARYGINLDAMWEEVRRTNWEKLGGPVREDGKILKPEGWKPPNTAPALSGIPMGDEAQWGSCSSCGADLDYRGYCEGAECWYNTHFQSETPSGNP